MAKTDAQYRAMLIDDTSVICVLVEASYNGGNTTYLSNLPYVSGSSATPSNTPYLDVIKKDVEIRDRLGQGEISQIELINDGSLDDLLDNVYRGYALKILLGEYNWDRDDFRTIVNGVSGGIQFIDNHTLALVFLDRTETLQQAVATETAPITLGKVFNAKPVFISGTKYKVHDTTVDSFDEIRDNGAALTITTDYTEDKPNGEFTLVSTAEGTITADVTVGTNYDANEIITDLCGRISVSVDSANLSAYGNTDQLGLYADRPTPVVQLIEEILKSTGGSWRFNSDGELQIFRLEAPAGTEDYELIEDDILTIRGVDQIKIDQEERPTELFTLGYKKNWHVQDPGSLATSVSDADKDSYATEYLTKEKDNNITATYPIARDDRVDTLLFDGTEAQTEANRRGALRNTRRKLWSVECVLFREDVKLGDTVKLTYDGFGFESGVNCRVVGVDKKMISRRMVLKLWL